MVEREVKSEEKDKSRSTGIITGMAAVENADKDLINVIQFVQEDMYLLCTEKDGKMKFKYYDIVTSKSKELDQLLDDDSSSVDSGTGEFAGTLDSDSKL